MQLYQFNIRLPNGIPALFIGKENFNILILYFMIAIILLILGGWLFLTANEYSAKGFINTSKLMVVVICLGSIVLYQGIYFSKFIVNVYRDHKQFKNKSLEERLQILILNQYYPFLSYCKNKLPVDVSIQIEAADSYYDFAGYYYLYPLRRVDEINKNNKKYLIFFHGKRKPKQNPVFTYKQDEMIYECLDNDCGLE